VHDSLDEQQQADLAALADGSLPPHRRAEIEAAVAASPTLRAALDRQRAALHAIRAAEEVPAPERLRAWLRAHDAGRDTAEAARVRGAAPRWRTALAALRRAATRGGGAAAGVGRPVAVGGADVSAGGPAARRRAVPRRGAAVVALAAAAVLAGVLAVTALDGGGSRLEALAAAAARAPEGPAPRLDAARLRLDAESDGVAFPDWGPRFGWRATGVRTDAVGGRRAVTVTYVRAGRRLAYAILARPALDLPEGDDLYRTLRAAGRPAVAWLRDGRTCLLLGGRGVSTAELRRLAASARFY
jgi:hypothetical protein